MPRLSRGSGRRKDAGGGEAFGSPAAAAGAELILRAIERARETHARQAEPLVTEAPGASAAQGEAEAAEAAGARDDCQAISVTLH